MIDRTRALALLPVLALAGCGGEAPAVLDSDAQKASYAIGLDMGRSLVPAVDHVDVPALMKGIRDAMAQMDPAVEPEELQTAMSAFNQTVTAQMEADRAAAAETNQSEGETFLADNGAKEGITVTESGLQYEVLREGDGPSPEAGQQATLHYRGTLVDGTEFDTSYDGDPATFGVDAVIPGFTEALMLMKVGAHHRVFIPSELAYGPQGSPPAIGPNQVLIFEIELLGVQ